MLPLLAFFERFFTQSLLNSSQTLRAGEWRRPYLRLCSCLLRSLLPAVRAAILNSFAPLRTSQVVLVIHGHTSDLEELQQSLFNGDELQGYRVHIQLIREGSGIYRPLSIKSPWDDSTVSTSMPTRRSPASSS